MIKMWILISKGLILGLSAYEYLENYLWCWKLFGTSWWNWSWLTRPTSLAIELHIKSWSAHGVFLFDFWLSLYSILLFLLISHCECILWVFRKALWNHEVYPVGDYIFFYGDQRKKIRFSQADDNYLWQFVAAFIRVRIQFNQLWRWILQYLRFYLSLGGKM